MRPSDEDNPEYLKIQGQGIKPIMRKVLILLDAAYGIGKAVDRKVGDIVKVADFGTEAYIADCIKSGHISWFNSIRQFLVTQPAGELAKEIDVDLGEVTGTGKSGKITINDVRDYAASE